MSGTGRGVAVLSRIEKTPQAATKVQEEEVQVPRSDLNSFFGKSDEENWISRVSIGKLLTAHHQREIAKARKNALGMLRNQQNWQNL